MKNFPEHNSFEELGKRLEGYTEQPDNFVWNNIDVVLRPHRTPLWVPWVDRVSTAASVILFALIFRAEVNNESPASTIKSNENVQPNRNQEALTLNVPQQIISDKFTPEKKTKETTTRMASKRASLKIDKTDTRVTPFAQTEISSHHFIDPPSNHTVKSESSILENEITDTVFMASPASEIDSSKTEELASKKVKRPKHGIVFYFSVTPQLSFQHVVPVSQDGIIVTDIYTQPIFSKERLALNVEFGIQGKLAHRLEYYGGLSVFQQRQTLKYEYQVTSDLNIEATDDWTYSITPDRRKGEVNYAMLNLGANAGLLYHLRGKKFAHKIGAGLSYQYGSRKTLSEGYENSASQYLFYQLHYRNELQLNSRLKLFIQPTFSQSFFVNQKLEAPFKVKPYRAGLGVGLLFRL